MPFLDTLLETVLKHAGESPHGIRVKNSSNSILLRRKLFTRRQALLEDQPNLKHLVITLGPQDPSEVWIIQHKSLSFDPRPGRKGRRAWGPLAEEATDGEG